MPNADGSPPSVTLAVVEEMAATLIEQNLVVRRTADGGFEIGKPDGSSFSSLHGFVSIWLAMLVGNRVLELRSAKPVAPKPVTNGSYR